MLNRIQGWDNIEAARSGEFQVIEPGWYPVSILKVSQEISQTGKDGIRFDFDIIDGKFKGYFTSLYKADAWRENRRWRGTYWQMAEGNGVQFLKGIITSIEESNPGYKFDWDETRMKGLKVGVGFRSEQYKANDGTLKFSVKPFAFCDVKKVIAGEMPVPKEKLLTAGATAGTQAARQGYTSPGVTPAGSAYNVTAQDAPKFEELDSMDEFPF